MIITYLMKTSTRVHCPINKKRYFVGNKDSSSPGISIHWLAPLERHWENQSILKRAQMNLGIWLGHKLFYVDRKLIKYAQGHTV